MKLFSVLLLLLFPSIGYSQAVWQGKVYNSRVCSNPNCTMCASIQAQLQIDRRVQSDPFYNFKASEVNWLVPNDQVQQVSQPQYELRTSYKQVAKRVKRCNGVTCWFETVYETVPVTERVLKTPQSKETSTARPAPASSLLTNTQLVPTPQKVVDAMVAELKLPATAKFFDLGCGDGRLLIKATETYACLSYGIELNPKTVAVARSKIRESGLSPIITVFEGDILDYDLSEADAVSMYLYPELMEKIVPRLKNQTLIVSYQHPIPGVESTSYSVVDGNENHIFYVGVK